MRRAGYVPQSRNQLAQPPASVLHFVLSCHISLARGIAGNSETTIGDYRMNLLALLPDNHLQV